MYVTLDSQRVFFDVVGPGLAAEGGRLRQRPVIVILHGGPGFDHTGLRPSLDALQDMAQLVYVDHRGNGRSVPSDSSTWTLAQWGDDVFNLCRALGIERPVVLGQSFGGMVAQAYATRHPDHPAGLILSSTAARMELAWTFDAFELLGGDEARAIAEAFWNRGDDAAFDDYMRVCMPLYNPAPVPGLESARQHAIIRREVFRHFSLPGREMRLMDFRASLGRVACPSLVISGDRDPVTPPHLSSEILLAIGRNDAQLQIFEGCGHGAFRDRPFEVLSEIRQFVLSLPRA